MKTNNEQDSLAGKKRFVQSLTHSQRFLNDQQFLTPVAQQDSNPPSSVKEYSINVTDDEKRAQQETHSYY
jgi:hypothetical protein